MINFPVPDLYIFQTRRRIQWPGEPHRGTTQGNPEGNHNFPTLCGLFRGSGVQGKLGDIPPPPRTFRFTYPYSPSSTVTTIRWLISLFTAEHYSIYFSLLRNGEGAKIKRSLRTPKKKCCEHAFCSEVIVMITIFLFIIWHLHFACTKYSAMNILERIH